MNVAALKSDKADTTRARILDAAARLFRAEGYASVSLRAIAAAAGMKAGSVYYHFESKEAIVIEILDAGIIAVHGKLAHTLDSLPADATAAATLRAGILAHLHALFEFSDTTSANVRIYSQVPASARESNRRLRRNYEALWAQTLERLAARDAIRPGVDLRATVLLIIGSLNATFDWFDPKRGSLSALADSYADIILNGVLAQRESTPETGPAS